MSVTKFELPILSYGFEDLVPNLSREQVRVHYTYHHNFYVEKLTELVARGDRESDEFLYCMGGNYLHTLYWNNLTPKIGLPKPGLMKAFELEFGGYENFKSEFSAKAMSVKGSGWVVLCDDMQDRLKIVTVPDNRLEDYLDCNPILVLDVWEHAYYIDYRQDRREYVACFWDIVNWEEVENRFGLSSGEVP